MLYDPKKFAMPEVPKVEPESEPWRKLLWDAANLIEEKGWCREAYRHNGRFCAIGAMLELNKQSSVSLMTVFGLGTPMFEAEQKVMAYLKESGAVHPHHKGHYTSLPEWNDAQPRIGGRRIVVETMRKVATS